MRKKMPPPSEMHRSLVRIPRDVMDFIREEAFQNCCSINSEIVRTLRMRKLAAEKSGRQPAGGHAGA